jgi:hypothetical protein
MQHRVSKWGWAILAELDRLIFEDRYHRNPVKFTGHRLQEFGLSSSTRAWALRQLEKAGAVEIEHVGNGKAPFVTHLSYPVRR